MKLVLLDMDGTLTLPRRPAEPAMLKALVLLKQVADVGIVSGSNLPKIEAQLNVHGYKLKELANFVFAENGAVAIDLQNMSHIYPAKNMIEEIGEHRFQELINFSLEHISSLNLPKKRGTFIELRSGLINISPIGRQCSQEERSEFAAFDQEFGVRNKFQAMLAERFTQWGIKFALGGEISIDCFPIGWDKRLCLSVADKYDEIHFVGDSIGPGGNDYEIFNDKRVTHPHATASPDSTLKIITDIIATT